jgi:2-iminobutanoate/2-iminopropanoate deaminase
MKVCLNPEELPTPPQPYSQLVMVKSKDTAFIFLSGQISINKDGTVFGVGEISKQAQRIFENIRYALNSVGASMSDIVSMTSYVTDMRLTPEIQAVRREFFPDKKNLPASTFVGVAALGRPELLLEIQVTAAKES